MINDATFRAQLRGTVYAGSEKDDENAANGDLGFEPAEILGLLLSGADQCYRATTAQRSIRLPLCVSAATHEVGHTDMARHVGWSGMLGDVERCREPNDSWTTFTPASNVNDIGPAYLAEHYAHEHMHRIGFYHGPGGDSLRPWSVPYLVGTMVCEYALRRGWSPSDKLSCRTWGNGSIRFYPPREIISDH